MPYFDIALDADIVGMRAEAVAGLPWAEGWSAPGGRVIVGQAVWVVEAGGRTVVVDPCGAADQFLRTGPEAVGHQEAVMAALDDAGVAVAEVDTVVLSHLDGIGMAAAVTPDGGWAPLFPRARVVLTEAELESVRAHPETGGAAALEALVDQGVVDGVPYPWTVAPGVTLEHTGGHSPGHAVLRVGEGATFLGHLALNPVQVVAGLQPDAHHDPAVAQAALDAELTWARSHDALVIGPLWPHPGAGRVTGPPWVVTPA